MKRTSETRASRVVISLVAVGAVATSLVITPPASAEAPSGRYAVNDGTVTDTRTRLTWQRTPDLTPRPWSQAAPYCSDLDLDGRGWRLPSIKELMTIVDESRWGPAIDPNAFPNTPSDYFWTSSQLATFPMFAWTVFFGKGTTVFFDVGTPRLVRCVR